MWWRGGGSNCRPPPGFEGPSKPPASRSPMGASFRDGFAPFPDARSPAASSTVQPPVALASPRLESAPSYVRLGAAEVPPSDEATAFRVRQKPVRVAAWSPTEFGQFGRVAAVCIAPPSRPSGRNFLERTKTGSPGPTTRVNWRAHWSHRRTSLQCAVLPRSAAVSSQYGGVPKGRSETGGWRPASCEPETSLDVGHGTRSTIRVPARVATIRARTNPPQTFRGAPK